jgi:hypothetical protein
MQKGDQNHMAADLAIAVFPRNTFKHHFNMRYTNTSPGEPMLLVGYSEEKLQQGATSSKRWGGVTVSQFMEQTTIVTRYNGSSNGVAVSPGDSGGPMFDGQCRIIGVASRMGSRDNYQTNKFSMHANLSDMNNQNFMVSLQEQMDAYFCDASGTDPSRCPVTNQFNWQPQGPNDFPCVHGGGASGSTPPDSAAPNGTAPNSSGGLPSGSSSSEPNSNSPNSPKQR